MTGTESPHGSERLAADVDPGVCGGGEMTENKGLPSGEEKRGGYSGGAPAKDVKPPARVPSGTITAARLAVRCRCGRTTGCHATTR
jgi:hypothetical protein